MQALSPENRVTSFADCRKVAFGNAPMLAGGFVTSLDRAPGKPESLFANKAGPQGRVALRGTNLPG